MILAGHFEIESKLAPGARVRELRPVPGTTVRREGYVAELDLSWNGETATLFGFLVLWDAPVGGADSYSPEEFGLLEVIES